MITKLLVGAREHVLRDRFKAVFHRMLVMSSHSGPSQQKPECPSKRHINPWQRTAEPPNVAQTPTPARRRIRVRPRQAILRQRPPFSRHTVIDNPGFARTLALSKKPQSIGVRGTPGRDMARTSTSRLRAPVAGLRRVPPIRWRSIHLVMAWIGANRTSSVIGSAAAAALRTRRTETVPPCLTHRSRARRAAGIDRDRSAVDHSRPVRF